MKRSTDRILTSHVGSLPRPQAVIDIMIDRPAQKPFAADESRLLDSAISDVVKQQKDAGIDIPSDGEFSKNGFAGYIGDRLTGFEPKTGTAPFARGRDRAKFADAYEDIDGSGNSGRRGLGAQQNLVCTGPIKFVGESLVREDIARLKAAMQAAGVEEAFVPATAPGTIELQRPNEYYKTSEEYLYAIADAMRTEFRMVVEAGLILQIDDPRAVTAFDGMDPAPSAAEYRKFLQQRVDALNHALEGLPEESVRYHVCWGSWHGPHTTDIPLKDIIEVVLKIKAQCYSIEAANPRHAHEYHVFEDVKLPDGKFLMPGVIAHTTNCVEHPELVAERIINYAKLVGRENVIAGTDCGFAQSFSIARVHPSIMWEKFRMLDEGAKLATQQLWR